MLEQLRRHGRSTWSKVLLGFLAIVFCFWGIGYGFLNRVHPVAAVNGQRILASDIDRESENLKRTLQQVYGADTAQILKSVNLRQEALDQLIERRLVVDEARHLGIRVSDDSLQNAISEQAVFQVDGQFDFQRYQDVLRSNDLEPAEFETSTRNSMIQDALRQMVDQGVQVSPGEVRHAYDLKNEKVALAYLVIPYQDFTATVAPTEAQLEDFYKVHAEDFREPERIKIAYIHYDPMLLAAKINSSDPEIEDYYKRNLKAKFTYPDRVHARHLLVEVLNGATPEEKATAKAKAEGILKQAQAGADFAKLAKQYSEDTSSRLDGGDLGTFGRGQLIKPIDDAVFSMKPGESRLVETRFGFHVVKVDSFSPAHTDTLNEARPKIIEALRNEAGERIARESLDQDVSAALSGESLQDIAKKRGLEAVETPSFSRREAMNVVHEQKLLEAAFKLDPGQITAVPAANAPYLLKLVSRDPSTIPAFKDIGAKVRESYIAANAEAQARTRAQQLLGLIKSPADFDLIAAQNKLTVHKTDPFARSGNSIPGVGSFPEVTDAAGVAPQVPGVIARVMESRGDSYIFELLSRTGPSDEDWKSAEKEFTDEFLQHRRAEAWTLFVNQLKARARITIDADQIGQSAS